MPRQTRRLIPPAGLLVVAVLAGCPQAQPPADAPPRADAGPGQQAGTAAPQPDDDDAGTGEVTPQALDLAVYPGAEQTGSGNVDGPAGHIMSLNYSTEAEFQKVAAFYRQAYPQAQARETGSDAGRVLALEISAAPDIRTVTVTEQRDAGGVALTLMRHRVK